MGRVVARGGFGTVYEGYDGDEKFAIKIANSSSIEARLMMQREAHAMRQVGPTVVPAIRGDGLTQTERRAYLVMEWISAPTVAHRMFDIGAPMAIAEFGVLMPSILLAVRRLHEAGIVHGDLKPEHLVLEWKDGVLGVRMLDLGLAVPSPSNGFRLRPSLVLGTAGYMAPEQVELEPVSPQSDIYALGVIMYEMLSGELPFDGTSSEQHIAHVRMPAPSVRMHRNVPPKLDRVIQRCMRKDPTARYASATTLRIVLEDTLRAIGA